MGMSIQRCLGTLVLFLACNLVVIQEGCQGLADLAKAAGEGYAAARANRGEVRPTGLCGSSCQAHTILIVNRSHERINFSGFTVDGSSQRFQTSIAPHSYYLQQWVGGGNWQFRWSNMSGSRGQGTTNYYSISCDHPDWQIECSYDGTYVSLRR